MPLLHEAISKRLREVREKPPKMSQAAAAEASGVGPRMWTEYEAGRVAPPFDALERFAAARGISLVELIGGYPVQEREEWEVDIPIVDSIPAGPLLQGFGEGGIIGYIRAAIRDPDAFGLIVTGASMSPEIQEDDIVLCSPRASFANGKIYAVVTGESEQSLKRVRRDNRSKAYALIPTNKDFPTLYVPEEQVLKLIRVVEVRRDLQ